MIDQIKEISTKLPVLESVSPFHNVGNTNFIAAGEQGAERYSDE
jgi:hypothetical protein